ncbi:DNA mismatch repair ATPase msh1 [Nowakowskiella sp. JEL0078]|nr:DNA mismatch repair ATPase msh1 [Nowakowskiella sp. JEL0078]
MDEIGRGTSVNDGISISFSVVKHLQQKIKCRTLFATHYHDVAKLMGYKDGFEIDVEGIDFYKSSMEIFEDNTFGFNYKLERGVISNSQGIVVAKSAGK